MTLLNTLAPSIVEHIKTYMLNEVPEDKMICAKFDSDSGMDIWYAFITNTNNKILFDITDENTEHYLGDNLIELNNENIIEALDNYPISFKHIDQITYKEDCGGNLYVPKQHWEFYLSLSKDDKYSFIHVFDSDKYEGLYGKSAKHNDLTLKDLDE